MKKIIGILVVVQMMCALAGVSIGAEAAQGWPGQTVAGKLADKPDVFPQLGHSAAVSSVSFSPDGRFILSASYDILKLWDVASGREVRTFTGHSAVIRSVVFSPDGRCALSGSDDKSLKLWDVASGNELRTFTGHSAGIKSVAFSPDGKLALSGAGDGALKLWDVANGMVLRSFDGHEPVSRYTSCDVTSVAFSPDGRYALSGSHDKTLKLWNVASGEEVRSFEGRFSGHKSFVNSVAFSPDGKYVLSGSADETMKLWDVASGNVIRAFKGKSYINSVAFSPDGKHALTSGGQIAPGFFSGGVKGVTYDTTMKLWDVASGDEIRIFTGHTGQISSVAFSPDGAYAISGSEDNTLKLWDIANGKEVRSLTGYSNSAVSVRLSPDGKHILTANGNNLLMLDMSSGRVIKTFTGHSDGVIAASFSPDGKYVLSGSKDKCLKLWDVASGREIRTFTGHAHMVNSVAFTPDGRHVLSSGGPDKTMKLWDVASGRELRTIMTSSNAFVRSAFSPDGKHAVSIELGNTAKLWDVASGKEILTLAGHKNLITKSVFSTDGTYVLTGSADNTLKLWDVLNGKEVRTYLGYAGYSDAAFSPDGKYILSVAKGNALKLWDMASGREIRTFTGRVDGYITSVALTSDGKRAVSGDLGGSLRQWDIATGKELSQFVAFTDGEWIAITPDGYYNASPKGDTYLNVRIGNSVYGIENYREAFMRPDLVKIALSGGSLTGYRTIADVKTPPRVEFAGIPQTVTGDELTVKLNLTDTGGGVGDVRLYLNGSAIKLDTTRSLKRVEKSSQQGTATQSYKIRLVRGDNLIRAVAFNADNSMQSNPAEQTVTATFTASAKPTLHAVVIGINEFKNPKLHLQYAVPDADLFGVTLAKGASDLFGTIDVVRLTTPAQTTSENIANELMKMQRINPEDMFILFVASHGTVDDGEYYLITSNVGSTSTAKLKTDALSQNRIKDLIANIPATKKVIVLDTCNAGQMGNVIQVAMLTRGMSEDTAFKILSRAVGSTILSSSTSTQEALEGYQGHGLFTWVLAEGMKGKADKGQTGFIKTTDLVDYVEGEVPDIAERHFKRKQYPTTAVSGQGFPIGKVYQ